VGRIDPSIAVHHDMTGSGIRPEELQERFRGRNASEPDDDLGREGRGGFFNAQQRVVAVDHEAAVVFARADLRQGVGEDRVPGSRGQPGGGRSEAGIVLRAGHDDPSR